MTDAFTEGVRSALANATLQEALAGLDTGLVAQRRNAIDRYPGFDDLRNAGRAIREATLERLDEHLLEFERRAIAAGSQVYWASTAGDARGIIEELCREAGARLVLKGKSMVSEEIGLNAHLIAAGFETVETDLGEYIVQMRGEKPSHIIAPAIHLTPSDVEADFRRLHTHLQADRVFSEPADLVAEARGIMRDKFLEADVGITGANFLVAETGSSIIVTNEGNGDLTQSLPKIHIVLASIEKVVPTLDDAAVLLRLLARSATGQDITAYTTFATGPKRSGDRDGPEACHIVILDNGRCEILGSPFRDVMRCIRCGACMNHCPVYKSIGGHAYGSVYPGPIGAVLTPALDGIPAARDLPNASTFCGRCEEVCPVQIPLVSLMRRWREVDFASAPRGTFAHIALTAWGSLARRPHLYHPVMRFTAAILGVMGRGRGSFTRLPFAGAWTRTRNLPVPQGRTFQKIWSEYKRGVPR